MDNIREQTVDLIFSLSEEQLEQLRSWINENTELEDKSKEVMNQIIDNAKENIEIEEYSNVWEQYVNVGNLKELNEKLRNVSDSYPAFIGGIIRYAATDRSRKEKVLAYMNEHPDATTSKITKFVMDQDDFHEAAKSTRKE